MTELETRGLVALLEELHTHVAREFGPITNGRRCLSCGTGYWDIGIPASIGKIFGNHADDCKGVKLVHETLEAIERLRR